ncbi:hypothetical protein RvY_06520 [Ramazzottius varieornatus]|uniref:Uncharacterized protein n=1 Tax=Ramazzottius varieornatus TaxID=947166 RepID=A0A1D1V8G8_RAMVA|nr:hypothetical protein RvY_06520 [Ramazzottius varieornatus]
MTHTPSTSPGVLSTQQATNTPKPVVPVVRTATTSSFASTTARKPQLQKNNEVLQNVRPVAIRGTRQADEKTIGAHPLRARDSPRRDFAIRDPHVNGKR